MALNEKGLGKVRDRVDVTVTPEEIEALWCDKLLSMIQDTAEFYSDAAAGKVTVPDTFGSRNKDTSGHGEGRASRARDVWAEAEEPEDSGPQDVVWRDLLPVEAVLQMPTAESPDTVEEEAVAHPEPAPEVAQEQPPEMEEQDTSTDETPDALFFWGVEPSESSPDLLEDSAPEEQTDGNIVSFWEDEPGPEKVTRSRPKVTSSPRTGLTDGETNALGGFEAEELSQPRAPSSPFDTGLAEVREAVEIVQRDARTSRLGLAATTKATIETVAALRLVHGQALAARSGSTVDLDRETSDRGLILAFASVFAVSWAIIFYLKTGDLGLALGGVAAGNMLACMALFGRS